MLRRLCATSRYYLAASVRLDQKYPIQDPCPWRTSVRKEDDPRRTEGRLVRVRHTLTGMHPIIVIPDEQRKGGRRVRRAIAYVDGFNVYHGVHQLTGRKYLWLDVQSLCHRLSPQDHELLAVKYFTARVRGTTPSYRRQNRYL